MSFKTLVADTIEKCAFHGFSVNLPHRYSVEGCGGFVDDSRMKFAVALRRPHWREVFLHEACHIDQYIDEDPLWTDSLLAEKNFTDVDLHTEEDSEEVFFRTMLLEHDCDKRALTKIDSYRISENQISREAYIQAANCYHASYFYFWKYTCFYDTKHVPYNTQHLLDLFPKDRLLSPQTKWKERALLNDFFLKYSKPLV
jgi:hypothetical protein